MEADEPVLVVLVAQPRDLDLVHRERWYRIPAKRAPRLLTQAHFIAFYLTKSFGEDKWSIREYAQVRGHELVRRRDLFPEETNHPRADEPYYKLQLGSIIPLPRPITSRLGRRILFFWTTGLRFDQAVEINDLLGKSDADDALWEALKESRIPAERQAVVTDERSRYRVDYWIACAKGGLAIFLGEPLKPAAAGKWRRLCFSEQDIFERRADCVAQISSVIHELGDVNHPSELST